MSLAKNVEKGWITGKRPFCHRTMSLRIFATFYVNQSYVFCFSLLDEQFDRQFESATRSPCKSGRVPSPQPTTLVTYPQSSMDLTDNRSGQKVNYFGLWRPMVTFKIDQRYCTELARQTFAKRLTS